MLVSETAVSLYKFLLCHLCCNSVYFNTIGKNVLLNKLDALFYSVVEITNLIFFFNWSH